MAVKTKKKKAYFIGIKGVGMTMLAQFLHARGYAVSGSDVSDTFLTDAVLRRLRIPVRSPFAPENIPAAPGMVVHSSAFSAANNSELAYLAKHQSKVPVFSYAEALGREFNRYRGIAVCGSHGKTTTTAWLGYVLMKAGRQPNVLVGSNVPQFRGSGLTGRSPWLVAETDEYQNKLRFFDPQGIVLNNIDYDHPDFFKDRIAYRQVFQDFVAKLPASGWLIVNGDDTEAMVVSKACPAKIIRCGVNSAEADYLATDLTLKRGRQAFRLQVRGRDQGEFRLSLYGIHNVHNALGVIAAARQLGVSWIQIRQHLGTFRGTERRSQVLGEYQGALIIDDYAHHPAEIRATLAALRARWPHNRLVTVFHPHTFSRTRALFDDFVDSFSDTDILLVLDIYGSAREAASERAGMSGAKLARAVVARNRQAKRYQAVESVATLDDAAKRLCQIIKPGDRAVLMGAGDVFRIGGQLLSQSSYGRKSRK